MLDHLLFYYMGCLEFMFELNYCIIGYLFLLALQEVCVLVYTVVALTPCVRIKKKPQTLRTLHVSHPFNSVPETRQYNLESELPIFSFLFFL